MKKNDSNIKKAIKYLNNNECIAIPTETVYGLAGNAYSDKAVLRVYRLKKRPRSNPLITHYYSINNLKKDCEIDIGELAVRCPFFDKLKDNPQDKVNEYVLSELNSIVNKIDEMSEILSKNKESQVVNLQPPPHIIQQQRMMMQQRELQEKMKQIPEEISITNDNNNTSENKEFEDDINHDEYSDDYSSNDDNDNDDDDNDDDRDNDNDNDNDKDNDNDHK